MTGQVHFADDVLGPSASDWVQRQINGPFIITVQGNGIVHSVPQLLQEAMVPRCLVRSVCHGHVLCLSGVLSDCLLLSRRPANSTFCK